jgi:uncharacterized membrane protein
MGGPLASAHAPLAYLSVQASAVQVILPPQGGSGMGVTRLRSIDIVRGVVMVLMAIDHVRVYSGVPAGGPTAGVFFTRWVTHFCAPAFVFLAGTGAYLHGLNIGDRRALSRYLATRGLILVLLELTVIRFSWTFNFQYSEFVLAGVIWMLGWCMVLMAGLVRCSTRTIAVFGLLVMFGQQIFGLLPRALPAPARDAVAPFWNFFYPSGSRGWEGMTILYTLVPWIGVMAAGYAFGAILTREPVERRRLCLRIGLAATALFVVFVGVFLAFAPAGEGEGPALFRALNPPKYPASQPFLLMTLGPTIALLPLAERVTGRIAGMFETFGRVPMFYYLLHIPLIHVTSMAFWYLRDGGVHAERFATAPFVNMPPEQQWGLGLLYLVFAIDVAILYIACRWFAAVKARRHDAWLRYL